MSQIRQKLLHFVRALVDLIRRPRSRRAQIIVGVLAVVLLLLGTVAAVSSVPEGTEIRWWPLVALVIIGTPWGVFLLSAEVGLTGRLAGVRLPRVVRVRVALLGTALNLLPIPGAALTRVDALVAAGAPLGRSTAVIVVVGVVWIAVSVLAAGLALVGVSWASIAFLLGGAAAVAAVVALFRHSVRTALPADIARLVLLEVIFTVTSACRFALSLAALDAVVPIRGVVAMAASAALSAAVGLAPGGLGIKEGLATLFGGVAGIPASLALLAALLNRAAALAGALLVSLIAFPVLQLLGTPAAEQHEIDPSNAGVEPGAG